MAILTLSGRAAIAASLKTQPIHLAWGAGSTSWDTNPEPEPIDASALVSEVGRRAATTVRFCIPSADGEIIVPTGRFTEVAYETNHLYTRFNFDFADSPDATIREVAIYIGSQVKANLPAGQVYFAPSDLEDNGILLVLERFAKFERSAAVRQSFEFVVTI